MQFLEYGINHDKTILFLHGGGLAPWNYKEEAMLLKEKYHILLPILDGHNGSDWFYNNRRCCTTYHRIH